MSDDSGLEVFGRHLVRLVPPFHANDGRVDPRHESVHHALSLDARVDPAVVSAGTKGPTETVDADGLSVLVRKGALVMRIARSVGGTSDLAATMWLADGRAFLLVARSSGVVDLLQVSPPAMPALVDMLLGSPTEFDARLIDVPGGVLVVLWAVESSRHLAIRAQGNRWGLSPQVREIETIRSAVREWIALAIGGDGAC